MTHYDDDLDTAPNAPAWALAPDPVPLTFSPECGEIFAALVVAQANLENIAQDGHAEVTTRTGGSYSYSYSSLGSVLRSVRPVLAAAGIGYLQGPLIEADRVTVETRLVHASGQWIEGRVTLPLAPNSNPQEIGSAITYARRYGISTIVGIAPEVDDDGAAASSRRRGQSNDSGSGPDPYTDAASGKRYDENGTELVALDVHRQLMAEAAEMTPEQRTAMTKWRQAEGITNMTARHLTAADAERVLAHIAEVTGRAVANDAPAEGTPDAEPVGTDEGTEPEETLEVEDEHEDGIDYDAADTDPVEDPEPAAEPEETARQRRARIAREEVAQAVADAQAGADDEDEIHEATVRGELDDPEPEVVEPHTDDERPFTDDEG